MAVVSPQRISDLIGSIYDCALDPSLWQETLRGIRDELAFQTTLMEVYTLSPAARLLMIPVGIGPDWLARAQALSADIIEMWGGRARIAGYPLEEPLVLSPVAGEARFANRYYREWKQAQGLTESVRHGIPVRAAGSRPADPDGVAHYDPGRNRRRQRRSPPPGRGRQPHAAGRPADCARRRPARGRVARAGA